MEKNQIKALLKKIVNISDEDWDKFQNSSPGPYKFFQRFNNIAQYRIVAEVIESKYCAAGIEKGQKIVIEAGALVPAQSTAPLCMRAIGPLTGFVNTFIEKIVAGTDPNDSVFRVAECLDPGLEAGGLGKVKFLLRAELIK